MEQEMVAEKMKALLESIACSSRVVLTTFGVGVQAISHGELRTKG